MRTYKKSLWVFLSVLALLFITACGSDSDKEAEETTSGDGGESYTVKHAMGETEIPEKPKKVVVLTNEGTEAVLALGVQPTGAVQSWLGDPWYKHIEEDMDGVEVVGLEQEVNVEKIAELQPDLIIGNKQRQEAVYDKLSAIAPTVFSEQLRGDWKENFKLYAEALGLEDKGEEVLADYDAHVEEVKTALGDKTDQEVSVVRFMAGTSRIYYKDSFSGVILDELGFKRTEAQTEMFDESNKMGELAIEVGKEAIPKMDGDILFYFTYAPQDDPEALSTEEEWTSDPLWKNLNVVQEGNAHKVSDAVWNTAGGVIAANQMLDELQEIMTEE
ncbi:iron-siderophore ABC transporter substrate-binding protein [Halobacillus sp. ACCC02827]|uniref:ABC transporter substrate-binding protein n=1 Tax=Halobacillus sp. ACCC02827 TaxID=3052090 RepID=UPI002570510A|nr:iron-siderophore ABC transporter substrate-binding protein [Halobacillus sp. ACCC02827]WJE15140.1 iron-siderophore ABC transporter substrate-binding protein [Halobacillus sp. ACCC02827]